MLKVFELLPHHKVYIAGHRGMVGSAILRALDARGHTNIVGRSSSELDLRDQAAVKTFFELEKPDVVFLAAAKVGGILANSTYPVEFLTDNLRIQLNVIDEAYKSRVQRLLFLGSSCIYPKYAPQPIKEEYLLTGELEPTNDAYAIAKIAGIKQVQAYRTQYGASFVSVMPTNLYGPGDSYDPETSHVIPALIRKFYEAKRKNVPSISIWGSGLPKREFLHVDDLAEACLKVCEFSNDDITNVGSGSDLAIRELVELLAKVSAFEGKIIYDLKKPDGTMQKLLDSSRIGSHGWFPRISLEEGIKKVYSDYLNNQHSKITA